MRGDIAFDMFAMLLVVLFDEIEYLFQCASIEIIFEKRRFVLRFRRGIRRNPILVIIGIPLSFESLAPSGSHPKLGLLQMDCLRARIQCTLDSDTEKLAVIDPRAHVVDVTAMGYDIAIFVRLRFIHMVDSVESPVKVILIRAPRHTGHYLDDVTLLFPFRDIFDIGWQYSVTHDYIRAQVKHRVPRRTRLEAGSLQDLIWIRGAF
jgi:hypothetical protein